MKLSDRLERRANSLAVRSLVHRLIGMNRSGAVLAAMSRIKRFEARLVRKVGL
jgi:hypothetical protein